MVIDWEHNIPPIAETKMFTVLSNTRSSNLILIGALAIVLITLLTLAVVPAISVPESVPVPAVRFSEAGSDYYQRHPQLSISAALGADAASDYHLRHPGLSGADVITPLVASPETPGMACESPVDCR
jgi:hypothetical protein